MSRPVTATEGTASLSREPAAPTRPQNGQRAQAAREFEAIFVRAMLRSTPLAKGGEAYGDLVVDAVATAVTEGKGLGMAEIIARGVGGGRRDGEGE